MNAIEIFSAVMVGLFVIVRARADDDPRTFLLRLVCIAAASWIGEQSCITAYGFYAYTREAWTLWLGSVPLAVVVIWPTVIHSAWDLARQMRPAGSAFLAACMVFADAWLIEPVSVRAGLWAWTEPGLFEVPPIGVLGWAIFAFFAIWLLERGLRGPRLVILVVLAPLLLHSTLLAFWWGGFRWV